MSAFYALAYEDRVELLTDGAVYEADGTLVDIRSKVWTSQRVPLAVTGRGDNNVVEVMARLIVILAACGSFDETMDRLADIVAARRDEVQPKPFEMVIAGMSDAHGPSIYYFASVDPYDAFEPWTLYRIPSGELGGGNAVDVSDLDASKGLLGIGAELFDRMRAMKGPNPTDPDAPHLYGIGGHVDWTVVAANGAETMRIHEWPDVIGEKINPDQEGREPAWSWDDLRDWLDSSPPEADNVDDASTECPEVERKL